MLPLLTQGQYEIFALLLIAIILSLSMHEFGHAYVAKLYGDNTAQQAGRMTINPIAHIDVLGLLMVVFVGFGYAKPVPTDPRNFRTRGATFWVAGAGPGMNLIFALVAINVWALMASDGQINPGAATFLILLAQINLLLMIFNLIPLGPLDGHYMLPYLLPRGLAMRYAVFNDRFGTAILLGVIVLSVMGIPILSFVLGLSESLLRYLVLV